MKITVNRMAMLSLVMTFGMGVKNHAPTSPQRKPLPLAAANSRPLVETDPQIGRAAAFCSQGASGLPKEIGFDKELALMAFNSLREMAIKAEKNQFFVSGGWKEFNNLIVSFTDQELLSFGGVDRNNAGWLDGALGIYADKSVCRPFKDTRELLTFMTFLNIFGVEVIDNVPQSIASEKDVIRKNVTAFRQLNSAAKKFPGLYVSYQHPQYLFVYGRFVKPADKIEANSGKWVILVDSLENAEKIAKEALLPCFAYGRLDLMKFDLSPFIENEGKKGYRIIIYASYRDTKVKEILEQLTKAKIFWVHEWECYEAGILQSAVNEFINVALAERDHGAEEARIKNFMRQVRDKDFMPVCTP